MILKKLILNNFGLYAGENEFDLTPTFDGKRPVILVCGHNGGGKTTFLEAVRLALYGKRSLGVRVARSEYEAYLLQRIHTHAEEKTASVKLTFSLHEQGSTVDYAVQRSWSVRGTSISDSIKVARKGILLNDIPSEDWDHYLEDLIPSGISQLFFFDGEKIQEIADDTSMDILKDSIRSLLGLDLIDQLRSDLALYTTRRNPSGIKVDIETIENNLNIAKTDLLILEENAALHRADLSQADRKIAKAQMAFDAEGGVTALNRAALKQSLKEVEKQINWLQSDLKRLAESSLPLGLAPSLIARLNKVISKPDISGIGKKTIREFLTAFQSNNNTKSSKRQNWTEGHFMDLNEFLDEVSNAFGNIQLDADPTWIKNRINEINANAKDQATNLARELDNTRHRQALLKKQLQNLDEDAAHKALETLKTSEYERGRAETQLKEKEKAISSLRHRIAQLTKEREGALNVEIDTALALHKVDLGQRARAALSVYEERLLKQRMISLSNHFIDCFNGLIRKKRLLGSVEINSDVFDIALLDVEGFEISKEVLSAGERQIFAISMLWALGKTSGRDLPVIIDTPLARLDRVHRKSFMRDYVPLAGRQIILLCTDSELTPDLENLISPFVSRRYEIGVSSSSYETRLISPKLEIANAN